jgi:NADH dehydrogenase/NADH:ubiquinone oxidoreductase subunit G
MSVTLKIDDKTVNAKEEMTILEAAKEADIEIPTLCYHEELEPYGGCRICIVEVEKGGRSSIVASCGYPVEDGLKVKTRSAKIDKMRKTMIELIAPTTGEIGGKLLTLAREYKADLYRFSSRVVVDPTKCILCGLCVRRCAASLWDNAVGFVGRGIYRRVVLFPEKSQNCGVCQICLEVCPTGKIPSTGPINSIPFIDDVLAGRK